MDQSRFIAKHVVNLPKSGIRDLIMANPQPLNGGRRLLNPSNSMDLEYTLVSASVLIPSNSTGLELATGVASNH
ncbi:MAG TPA: hypothetical protein VNN22_22470 [Verrucomicrobiae bacterium]|nr:hypothetical protein [Verrucomicrobiae bacterium]